MPSPRWIDPAEPALFLCLAAAQHAAWCAAPEHRRRIFADTFRRAYGPKRAESVLASALALFDLQPAPPDGWTEPPSAVVELCPKCQRLKAVPHHIAPLGRVKLNALRDADWLSKQLASGKRAQDIAAFLGCDVKSVMNWGAKHGLEVPRQKRTRPIDDDVRRLHAAGLCPGEIATQLDETTTLVRETAKRLGLASKKRGWPYHTQAWWVERVVRRQWTTKQCAEAAGIPRNACAPWLQQFGLQAVTKARAARKGVPKAAPMYPMLADRAQCAALLLKHRSYEGVARRVRELVPGSRCGPTNVKRWVERHFGPQPARHHNVVPHAGPAWWLERLDAGKTTWEMAEEIGVQESTARERIRVLIGAEGLARAYQNNTAAERRKRAERTAKARAG